MISQQDNNAQPVKVRRRKGEQLPSRKGRNALVDGGELGERVGKVKLTRAQRAVLEVVTDPTLYKAKQQDRIKAADVSVNTYYRIIRDPAFKQLQQDFAHAMLRERIGPVLKAAYKTACTPGRDGFADRNILLQMTGMHTPRKLVDQHVSGQVAIGIVGVQLDQV